MVKYKKGQVIKHFDEYSKLVLLTDVNYDDEYLFAIQIDKNNNININRIIKLDNDESIIREPKFIHETTINMLINKIIELNDSKSSLVRKLVKDNRIR